MKIFVYNMRDFDELPYFKKYAAEYGVELGYTTEFPGPENWHYADGYDGISILTTPTEKDMIDQVSASITPVNILSPVYLLSSLFLRGRSSSM